jgi:hypothetical protein
MKNITLITSVIDPPNLALSYSISRSVFTKEERFEQTKKTILSIRNKIPENQIFLIECSKLSNSEINFFIDNVDIFLNIYEMNNENLINRIFSKSKSMGEGTMTIIALQYLVENNIKFDKFFKISGRYWLNDTFNYELYNNIISNIHRINNNNDNVFTCFYNLSNDMTKEWLEYLLNSENDFINCIGYENIFANFLKGKDIKNIDNKVGINGYVTVCGSFIDM